METAVTIVLLLTHATPLCHSAQVLITSATDTSLPVFEVYDTREDRVTQVEKVLGQGRTALGQAQGVTRIMENDLLVQYRVGTGEAWLVARQRYDCQIL